MARRKTIGARIRAHFADPWKQAGRAQAARDREVIERTNRQLARQMQAEYGPGVLPEPCSCMTCRAIDKHGSDW